MQVWVAAIAAAGPRGLRPMAPRLPRPRRMRRVRGGSARSRGGGAARHRAPRCRAAVLGPSSLSGWRIQYRNDAEYACYLAAHNDGCTDYLEKTLSVRIPPDAGGCFEAAELLHELGHYELGDPMHSNERWTRVEAQFAPMVWDREDAAPECVRRYHGIDHGMWPVRIDRF